MPVAQQNYATPKAFFNGAPITQVTSISMVTENGVTPIQLLGEGLGGFADGSGQVTIEIAYPIPIGGPEHPYQEACATRADVEFQVFFGRSSYNGLGKITSVNETGNVGEAASGTCNWTGPLKPRE